MTPSAQRNVRSATGSRTTRPAAARAAASIRG